MPSCRIRPLLKIFPLRGCCALTCCNGSLWCPMAVVTRAGFTRWRSCWLMSGRCELCTTQTDVEVHHIRRLKDLPPEDRAPQPEWVRQMASRRRKALIVCRDCHDDIHKES